MAISVAKSGLITYNSVGTPTAFSIDGVAYSVPATFPTIPARANSSCAVEVLVTGGTADNVNPALGVEITHAHSKKTVHASLTKA